MIEAMASLSGADGEAFFVAHGLGSAFGSPGRAASKKTRILAAVREAERRGNLLAVLDAARAYVVDRGQAFEVAHPVAGPVPKPVTAEQQLMLQLIWDFFSAAGRWPTFGEIDRRAYQSDELNIVSVAESMPAGLLAPQQIRYLNPEQELAITVAAASCCRGSEEVLELFLQAVRLAAQVEAEAPVGNAEPTLTVETFVEFREESGLPAIEGEQTLHCLGLLLGVEHWGYRTYSKGEEGGPASWSFSLLRDVRPMRDATDLTRYWMLTHPGQPTTDPDQALDVYVEEESFVAHDTGPRIFLVHGHDEARHEVDAFLRRSTPTATVITLSEQASGGQTVIEKFEAHGASAEFAVVLLTPDDLGKAQNEAELRPRARQNVVFELGYFIAKLGRSRVVVLNKGVEEPSDVRGLMYIKFPEGGQWKVDLSRELANVGIDSNPLRS